MKNKMMLRPLHRLNQHVSCFICPPVVPPSTVSDYVRVKTIVPRDNQTAATVCTE